MDTDQCHFCDSESEKFTHVTLRNRVNRSLGRMMAVMGNEARTTSGERQSGNPVRRGEALNLQPGEWVEVLSEEDILATLDENMRHKGLYFMAEMRKFCGQRFKVLKRVERIMIEATGEVKRLKTPAFYLEGAMCDGEHHGGCDRLCFCLWREDWLKRVPPREEGETSNEPTLISTN